MRIGISHWYSTDNLGDYAITLAQLKLLERVEGAEVALVIGVEEGVDYPPDVARWPTVEAPWSSPGTVGRGRWALEAARAALALAAPRSRLLGPRFAAFVREVERLDVVMPKGGGYLYAFGGVRGVLFTARIAWPLLLARRLGLRRMVWGHSIGPVESRLGGTVLRAALAGADIVVRDQASTVLLDSWRLPYRRLPDLAFLWAAEGPGARAPSPAPARATVGVTAKLIGAPACQQAYEDALVAAIDALRRHAAPEVELDVVLIPHVLGPTREEDDRPVIARIRARLEPPVEVRDVSHSDVAAALETYASLDLLVATRLHSAILASCVGVPFVVVEYIGGKAAGQVDELGLPDWVLVNDPATLGDAVVRGWDDRHELRATIAEGAQRAVARLRTLGPDTAARNARPLIVVGPTPPPIHGVAFATPHVIAALGAAGRLAGHVDTRDPRPVSTTGILDLRNAGLGLLHAARLARELAAHRGADVYVPLSQGTWGFVRDAVFIWMARAARRRVYIHLHGGLFHRFYRESGRAFRAFVRATLCDVHEAWVLTPAHTNMFEGLVPDDRIRVLENTVDDPTAAWDGGPHRGDGRRILYLSNLFPEKGCFDLLDAVDALGEGARGVEVRLVGEADPDVAAEVLRRAAALAERGVRVELAGVHVDREKALDYAWADVFALPSRYPPEGQPLVLLEAMAAGVPIVSTRHSGIPHTVRDGREGLIVPPGDVPALAEAIGRLMGDADLRARLGGAGRARYEELYAPDAFERRVRAVLS